MYFLPNDLLEKIIADLDIVSLIRLNSTSKKMHDIGLGWKLCTHPIQYLNKASYTTNNYNDLNEMVDDMAIEICPDGTKNRTIELVSQSKEYTTTRQHQNYTLQLNRNVRHMKAKTVYNYSFLIKKRGQKIPSFQLIYDPIGETYIGIQPSGIDIHLPLLFVFLGCKVLFKIHGYCSFKNLNKFPKWFTRVLVSKNYNGLMVRDIVSGFVVV
jgi:hypothetical protein